MKPYVGICDFAHHDEVGRMLKVFSDLESARSQECRERKLMIGAMMSYKTLHGLPTRWAKVWPKREEYAALFRFNMHALNCLHYADYENRTRSEDLLVATELCGPYLGALQLDMPWPDPNILRDFFMRYARIKTGYLKVILQVSGPAIDQAGGEPQAVAERLKEYGGLVNCALLDLSMGRGEQMTAEVLRPYISEIKAQLPRMSVAVAGGLGPESLWTAESLIAEFPDLSIDAQSKLRRSGNAADPIDWDLAEKYLYESVALFRKYELAKKK